MFAPLNWLFLPSKAIRVSTTVPRCWPPSAATSTPRRTATLAAATAPMCSPGRRWCLSRMRECVAQGSLARGQARPLVPALAEGTQAPHSQPSPCLPPTLILDTTAAPHLFLRSPPLLFLDAANQAQALARQAEKGTGVSQHGRAAPRCCVFKGPSTPALSSSNDWPSAPRLRQEHQPDRNSEPISCAMPASGACGSAFW